MKNKLLILMGFALTQTFAQSTKEAMKKLATPNIERTAYDVNHYSIDLDVDVKNKSLDGSVLMEFTALEEMTALGFDLDDRLTVDSVKFQSQSLSFSRTQGSREVLVDVKGLFTKNKLFGLTIYYHGQPQEAIRAPWDGGLSWKTDKNNKPWVGVSCEGDGASIWWPNKDLLSDEPDSVTFTCRYPDDLFFVSNGDMVEDVIYAEYRETTWKTTLPINNYNVTLNIADYDQISTTYKRENGEELRLDYYVLAYNKQKAEKHFEVVEPMMKIFENAFGAYPFSKDGYALVETPYLGMEHQSAIAYGNQYKKGYLGRYPKHMDFDFIVIHETGHEWWGNSVSMNDRADMWIHESFCTYSEAIFAEQYYGYEDMLDYLEYQKNFISNASPVQGIPHQHKSGHGTDIYYKGSWVLHTLRNLVQDDELWFGMIKDLALNYRIKNTDGVDVKAFMATYLKRDLDDFFSLYFDSVHLPEVEYKEDKGGVKVRLAKKYGFNLPLEWEGKSYSISHKWTKIKKGDLKSIKNQMNRLFLIKQV